jgi:hypothetical protein
MQFQRIHSSEYSELDVLVNPFMKCIMTLCYCIACCVCAFFIDEVNAAYGFMRLPVRPLAFFGLGVRIVVSGGEPVVFWF